MITLEENIAKLEEIRALESGWNSYDAEPIPSIIVDNAIAIIKRLDKQPFVAPVADGTISFEYEIDSQGLIFTIFEDKVNVHYMPSLNDSEEYDIKLTDFDYVNMSLKRLGL